MAFLRLSSRVLQVLNAIFWVVKKNKIKKIPNKTTDSD